MPSMTSKKSPTQSPDAEALVILLNIEELVTELSVCFVCKSLDEDDYFISAPIIMSLFCCNKASTNCSIDNFCSGTESLFNYSLKLERS